MAVPNLKRLVSIDEYRRMAETGIFSEGERLELIRGEIVEMTPIGNPHATCVRRLNHQLTLRFGSRALVDVQNPVALPHEQSAPQPDVVVLRPRDDFYKARMPEPGDVLLIVEVADSSVAYDRKVKIALYVEAGIPESWLADLGADAIFAYRKPSPAGYQEVREYRRGEWISPAAFPDERFLVDDLLG
jgi:Uma2 family endonuclease